MMTRCTIQYGVLSPSMHCPYLQDHEWSRITYHKQSYTTAMSRSFLDAIPHDFIPFCFPSRSWQLVCRTFRHEIYEFQTHLIIDVDKMDRDDVVVKMFLTKVPRLMFLYVCRGHKCDNNTCFIICMSRTYVRQ